MSFIYTGSGDCNSNCADVNKQKKKVIKPSDDFVEGLYYLDNNFVFMEQWAFQFLLLIVMDVSFFFFFWYGANL